MASARSASATIDKTQLASVPSAFTGIDKLNAQMASLRPRFVGQFADLAKQFSANRGFAGNGAIASMLRGYNDAAASLARHVATPTYFGALPTQWLASDIGGCRRISEQIARQVRPMYDGEFARLLDQLREPSWLDTIRRGFLAPLQGYYAWVEREWAELKARKKPPPVLFLLVSLPAMIAVPLLDAIEANDELLLGRLEDELRNGELAGVMQAAVQRSGLDAVAKRHLVQGLTWVANGRYVDAAPPLYQGLERAFKIAARERRVVDDNNRFLIAGHQRRASTVEDVFTYLGLDRFYIRFLNAWVFGKFGNSARHGDLGEDDHRRWVLRAVLGVAGWLEYLGGEHDYVALLVERLELEPGGEAADAT